MSPRKAMRTVAGEAITRRVPERRNHLLSYEPSKNGATPLASAQSVLHFVRSSTLMIRGGRECTHAACLTRRFVGNSKSRALQARAYPSECAHGLPSSCWFALVRTGAQLGDSRMGDSVMGDLGLIDLKCTVACRLLCTTTRGAPVGAASSTHRTTAAEQENLPSGSQKRSKFVCNSLLHLCSPL